MFNVRFVSLLCLILLVYGLGVSEVCALSADDNEYWVSARVRAPLQWRCGVKLTAQTRFRKDANSDMDLFYSHVEMGIPVRLTSSWGLEPAVRMIRTRGSFPGDDSFKNDLMVFANLVNKWKVISGWQLKSRLRLAVFERDSKPDTSSAQDPWEFQPRFDLMYAQGFFDSRVKPYVAYELMYRFNNDGHYRDRYYLGVQSRLCEQPLFGNVCLALQQDEKADGWHDKCLIQAMVTYKF